MSFLLLIYFSYGLIAIYIDAITIPKDIQLGLIIKSPLIICYYREYLFGCNCGRYIEE